MLSARRLGEVVTPFLGTATLVGLTACTSSAPVAVGCATRSGREGSVTVCPDHGWGPHLVVFVTEDELASARQAVDAGLPETFAGWPVR